MGDTTAAGGQRMPARRQSSAADAFSGDPTRAAAASAIAGVVQASLLLPFNTVQTQMQYSGQPLVRTMLGNFERGVAQGVRNLYRAIGPTVTMLAARQGFKFGAGASVKSQLPAAWPELGKDAVAGALSAMSATTLLFPLDTLKTRFQTGMAAPSTIGQFYYGFRPAVSYSAFGMALWIGGRNWLERKIPDPGEQSGVSKYWKHLFTGGLAGVLVQVPTFPFDTLKKRLQARDDVRGAAAEARALLAEGGLPRFYRGFMLKTAFVALNGAIFNAVYVGVRTVLRMHSVQ
jgi:hypothetical protein